MPQKAPDRVGPSHRITGRLVEPIDEKDLQDVNHRFRHLVKIDKDGMRILKRTKDIKLPSPELDELIKKGRIRIER